MKNSVIRFLKLNGFSKMEKSSYANNLCNVVLNKDGTYTVADNNGGCIYSNDGNIYWLIGVLTYYRYIDKNYKS